MSWTLKCAENNPGQLLVNISRANIFLGNGMFEPKPRSGSVLSFKATKRKLSGPEKQKDYSLVTREVCLAPFRGFQFGLNRISSTKIVYFCNWN